MSYEGEGIDLKVKGYDGAIEDLEKEIALLEPLTMESMREIVETINEEAKQNFIAAGHNITGDTVQSIGIIEEVPSEGRIRAGSLKLSAAIVEEGRDEVRPVKAKALRFVPRGAGAAVFSKRSRAVAADPFYEPAVVNHADKVPDLVYERLAERVGKAPDGVMRLEDG